VPPRVVVVGAGAIGLATASELLALGARDVVVLEQDQPASASSGLNVGIVETQYVDPVAIEVRVHAWRLFDRLARDGELEFPRTGYVRPAHDEATAASYAGSVEIQRSLGVGDARVIDAAELAAIAPHVRTDDVVAALYGPSDGYVDPHRYCAVLAARVRAGGGEIRTRCALVGAERRSGGRFELATSSGPLVCDVVVNAAGAWATLVGDLLDAPIEVVPQRRQAAVVYLPEPLSYTFPCIVDYTPGEGRLGLYLRHERADQLVAGLHSEEIVDAPADPDDYPRGADQDFVEALAEHLLDRLPTLTGARLGNGWSGLYPVSPRGPLVGQHPDAPGVVVAAGAGGSGLQASPAFGRLAAEWVLHGEPLTIPAARAYAP